MAGRKKAKWADPRELGGDTVDSPYGTRDRHGRPVQEPIARNVRESSIATMLARGQITAAQGRAADRFRAVYEILSSLRGLAIDPAREPVDGGGISDPIPDRVVQAGRDVGAIVNLVGMTEYAVLRMVAGEGYTLSQAAQALRGRAGDRDVSATGERLRGVLDLLATFWGYAGSPEQKRRVHRWLEVSGGKARLDTREWIDAITEK